MATKKLNADDVTAINSLRDEFQEVYNVIGLLSVDEKSLELQLEHVKQEVRNKFESFKQLRIQEEELMSKLKEQYGDGSINLAEGTFTSAD
jgi:hypothetical protein